MLVVLSVESVMAEVHLAGILVEVGVPSLSVAVAWATSLKVEDGVSVVTLLEVKVFDVVLSDI